MIELYEHQKKAIDNIRPGCILCGGTGSGKSITALVYYLKYQQSRKLYIITTAKKRDSLEWEKECAYFAIDYKNAVVVDSWNNIKKYIETENVFFIFDEQRVIGYGVWTKAFLKITKKNPWIMLSATPGDTWSDYIPVFIANGFYKNKKEFTDRHCVYSRHTTYPKIEKYIETGRLIKLRKQILISMKWDNKKTQPHSFYIYCKFNKELFDLVYKEKWNFIKNKPIKNASELCYMMRRCVNSSFDRIVQVSKILEQHSKVLIFYNFNYELELLLELGKTLEIKTTQLNGHRHDEIPKMDSWMHLIQYSSGSEAWNCIETDTVIFYSQTYSYRTQHQAEGRIDRLNSPYTDMYYFHMISDSIIDNKIRACMEKKKNFNIKIFDFTEKT